MPLFKPFVYLLLCLAFANSALPQDFVQVNAKIRRLVEHRDMATAIIELKNLQAANPKIFTANNYDYLLARLSEKQGDFATATANYQAIINRNSILKEYALWHLSQIMRSTGNLMMERIYLQELSVIFDQSLLNEAITKRFVRSNFESSNYSEVIKILTREKSFGNVPIKDNGSIIETVKEKLPVIGDNQSREDLVLLAQAYLQNKKADKAREVFARLVDNPPNKYQPDDFALAGAKGLDRLEVGEENFGKTTPELSDEEHFKRAEIYQFNRNFPLARIHYQAIVNNYSSSPRVPISLLNIGRGFGQVRDFENAVKWFEKLQNQFPEDALSASALYQTAGAYAYLDKTTEAVSRYEKYINDNPEADNLERAYLNIIDAYRDEGDAQKALQWTLKAQEKFKGGKGEAVALFSQARINIAQEDWQNAIRDLNSLRSMNDLGGKTIAGGTDQVEVTFLYGLVLEKSGRFDEAIDVYLTIKDGLRNYYGGRASERLKALAKNEKLAGKRRIIEQRFKPISPDVSIPNGRIVEYGRKNIRQIPEKTRSHKTLADELLFLGLYDEATPELETALRDDLSKNTGSLSDFPRDSAFTLAVFYKRGEMAHRAISYIEPLWKNVPGDYPVEFIPREQLELLYPKPYQESLVKYGRENQVDPRFLLSIMRVESRYQADVKSYAAARGLMQFISTTATEMANQMKIENFNQDDLYDPPTAIRFGSHYIAQILKDFPNQTPAVAASYNGGEDRMMRWFKRSKSVDHDRYVPEVVFSQTKEYVFQVMASYRVYQMLYDENLKEIH